MAAVLRNMSKIKRAHTLAELCEIILADGWSFVGANSAYALSRLAKLYCTAHNGVSVHATLSRQPGSIQKTLVLPALHALDALVMAEADAFEMWDIALTLWSYSSMGHYNKAVFECICQRGGTAQLKMKPVDCAMIMTSFGRFGHHHPTLLRTIPTAMLSQLNGCKAHEISQVVWGFARLGVVTPNVKVLCEAVVDRLMWSMDQFGCQFLQRLETNLVRLLPYLSPQDISNTMYSFVKLRYKPAAFMDAAPPHLVVQLNDFKSNEISQMLYGYTQSRHYHRSLLNAISSQLLAMSTQDVAISFWCYGIFLHTPNPWQSSHVQLRQLMIQLQQRQPGSFQQLQQMWQEQKSNESGQTPASPFVEMLAIAALLHVRGMKPQALSVVAKAYARLGGSPGYPLVAGIAMRAEELIERFRPDDMSHPLVAGIAMRAEELIERFRPDDMSALLFGLSIVGFKDLRVYYACVRHYVRILEVPDHPYGERRWMNSYVLNSIVKSCSRMGYVPWTLLDFAESRGMRLNAPDALKSMDSWDSHDLVGSVASVRTVSPVVTSTSGLRDEGFGAASSSSRQPGAVKSTDSFDSDADLVGSVGSVSSDSPSSPSPSGLGDEGFGAGSSQSQAADALGSSASVSLDSPSAPSSSGLGDEGFGAASSRSQATDTLDSVASVSSDSPSAPSPSGLEDEGFGASSTQSQAAGTVGSVASVRSVSRSATSPSGQRDEGFGAGNSRSQAADTLGSVASIRSVSRSATSPSGMRDDGFGAAGSRSQAAGTVGSVASVRSVSRSATSGSGLRDEGFGAGSSRSQGAGAGSSLEPSQSRSRLRGPILSTHAASSETAADRTRSSAGASTSSFRAAAASPAQASSSFRAAAQHHEADPRCDYEESSMLAISSATLSPTSFSSPTAHHHEVHITLDDE
eukprot:gene31146-6286_t